MNIYAVASLLRFTIKKAHCYMALAVEISTKKSLARIFFTLHGEKKKKCTKSSMSGL
jgi:hypothetical protein